MLCVVADYCHNKNSSCLTTNQLKNYCPKKLKTFKKIYQMNSWPSEIT